MRKIDATHLNKASKTVITHVALSKRGPNPALALGWLFFFSLSLPLSLSFGLPSILGSLLFLCVRNLVGHGGTACKLLLSDYKYSEWHHFLVNVRQVHHDIGFQVLS